MKACVQLQSVCLIRELSNRSNLFPRRNLLAREVPVAAETEREEEPRRNLLQSTLERKIDRGRWRRAVGDRKGETDGGRSEGGDRKGGIERGR
ncbi:hypothetical protein ACLOJK_035765 [Asimina triloba]